MPVLCLHSPEGTCFRQGVCASTARVSKHLGIVSTLHLIIRLRVAGHSAAGTPERVPRRHLLCTPVGSDGGSERSRRSVNESTRPSICPAPPGCETLFWTLKECHLSLQRTESIHQVPVEFFSEERAHNHLKHSI